MTIFKKSLALLLAFVMIFSTMSVMASAEDEKEFSKYSPALNPDGTIGKKGTNNSIEFDFEFERPVVKDGKTEWITTKNAAPGDLVRMVGYIGTDFPTHSFQLATLFDKKFFTLCDKNGNPLSTGAYTLEVNPSYSNGVSLAGANGLAYKEDPLTYTQFTRTRNIFNQKLPQLYADGTVVRDASEKEVLVPILEESFFNDRGLISLVITCTNSGAKPILINEWCFAIYFKVNTGDNYDYVTAMVEDEDGNLSPRLGFSKACLELANQPKVYSKGVLNFLDFGKGAEGADSWSLTYTSEFEAYITEEPALLSTYGDIILDANKDEGGYFSTESGNIDTILGSQGVIGTSVSRDDCYRNLPKNDQGKVFAGWSLTKDGEVLSATNFLDMKYDYEDITLYAVWDDVATDTTYTYEKYEMLPDGTYPETPASEQIDAVIGSTATIPSTPSTGFYLDETMPNVLSAIVNADGSTTLRVYFARNTHTVSYHYDDQSGPQIDKIEGVFFNQAIPAFSAVPGGPAKEGHKFIGWSQSATENIPAPNVMPDGNVDMYPVFEKNTYTVVFDAKGGTFSDDSSVKSFVYYYGDAPAAITEDPVKEGYTFSCWDNDLPATVTGDVTINAEYNLNQYTVTFMDGETVLDEIVINYGDNVVAEDIPEGYKADGWKLENNTGVNFPYTVKDDVTFYATDAANMYDAVYMVDGEVYETIAHEYGAAIVTPEEDPTKYGYKFVGWAPDTEDQTMDEDGRVYDALFIKDEFTIVIDANGGAFEDGADSVEITDTYTNDISEKLPEDPTMVGYTFSGWSEALPTTMPGEDKVITANWLPNTYTVKFVNGLDNSTIISITGVYGTAVAEPELPTVNGYSFEWDVTPPTSIPAYDEDNMLMANGGTFTVTAVPTANDITLSFNTNGGQPETIPEITGKYGETIDPAIANPTKDGHEFLGWMTDDGEIITDLETFPEDSTCLTAQWSKNSYVAVFNANGGAFDNDEATVTENVPYGDDIPVPEDPTRENYEFMGWDPVPGKMPAKTMVFTAIWEAIPAGEVDYTITVYAINPSTGEYLDPIVTTYSAAPGTKVEVIADGETAADDSTVVIDYENLYPAESNVPDKNNASNTADANGDRAIVVAEGAENNIVVYFKLTSHDVVFDANGGSFAEGTTITQSVTHGQAATAPTEVPFKPDSIFKGWDKEIPTSVTGPVTLKAVWETKTYEIDFSINGESYQKVTFNYGDAIVPPAYTAPEGYIFSGWETAGYVANDNTPASFDAKLTAVDYNVSYIALSGIPAGAAIPEATTAIIGEEITVSAATVPTGYEFNGWNVITAAGMVHYDAGDVYTMTAADVIFVGEFKALKYDIIFDVDGGNALENKSVEYGTSVDSLPTPSKSGNTFAGWVYEDGTAVELPFTMPASDVTVKATWTEVITEYKLSYTYNITPDGAAALPAEEMVEAGSTVTVATAPADTATHKFAGWYIDGELITTATITMPAHDETILGVWEVKETPKALLTLHANGGAFSNGEEIVTSEREVGSSLTDVVAQPTREGYTFAGWDKEIPATMPEEGLRLIAQWEVETYNVVFDTDGGSTIPGTTVNYGGKLEAPATEPTKPGFTFDGWDTTLPIDPVGDMGNDGDTITIKAKWEVNKNDITIDTDGGKFPGMSDEDFAANDVAYGTPLADVLPENRIPVKEGYTFSHWVDANGGVYTFPSTMPDAAIDVKAVYTPNEGTVAYKFDGEVPEGVTAPESATYDYNETVTVAAYPEAVEGYTFDGWYVGEDKYEAGSTFAMSDGSVELVGHWTKNPVTPTYTITFNAAGGMFDNDAAKTTVVLTLEEGDAIVAPADPTREGYVFNGWSPSVPTTMPAENLSVSAVWDVNDTRKNLIADANGGEFEDGTSIKNHKFNEGDQVDGAIEEPTRDGYEFAGWDGLDNGKMPEGDNVTIKATWDTVVTIDPNTGTFANGTTDKFVTSGAAGEALDTSALVPVSKDNANFLGWKNTATGEVVDTLPATIPEEPATFVAQWDDIEKHTIVFTVLGAEYEKFEIYEGDPITLPAVDPTVEGFDFEGWVLADGSEIPTNMGTADLVAIAVLTPHENTVTYYMDDTKTEVHQQYEAVQFGTEVPVPTDPVKEGYIFAGWSPEVTDTMPDEALEYVATWIEVTESFTVTYLIEEGKTYKTYVVEEGAEVPVPALNPVKFGYRFVGWDPEVPATMPSEDLVFVAQWEEIDDFSTIIIGGAIIGTGAIIGIGSAITTGAIITGASIIGGVLILWGTSELIKNTYKVTYIVDGEIYKTYMVLVGTRIPVPADPTKSGYEFAGWNPEVPERMPAEDLTFEAEWTGASAGVDDEIPDTGSATGIAAFAVISAASATAYIVARKKKEEDEE